MFYNILKPKSGGNSKKSISCETPLGISVKCQKVGLVHTIHNAFFKGLISFRIYIGYMTNNLLVIL